LSDGANPLLIAASQLSSWIRSKINRRPSRRLGQIVHGSWRQVALAHKLGVPKALGMRTEEWVRERLGGYARLEAPTE
jgi:hypothetical protein